VVILGNLQFMYIAALFGFDDSGLEICWALVAHKQAEAAVSLAVIVVVGVVV
jgi:hypothetical protein